MRPTVHDCVSPQEHDLHISNPELVPTRLIRKNDMFELCIFRSFPQSQRRLTGVDIRDPPFLKMPMKKPPSHSTHISWSTSALVAILIRVAHAYISRWGLHNVQTDISIVTMVCFHFLRGRESRGISSNHAQLPARSIFGFDTPRDEQAAGCHFSGGFEHYQRWCHSFSNDHKTHAQTKQYHSWLSVSWCWS